MLVLLSSMSLYQDVVHLALLGEHAVGRIPDMTGNMLRLYACSLVHLLSMYAVAAAAAADADSYGGPWGGSSSWANAAASGEVPQTHC
jgi:hypothetical protein